MYNQNDAGNDHSQEEIIQLNLDNFFYSYSIRLLISGYFTEVLKHKKNQNLVLLLFLDAEGLYIILMKNTGSSICVHFNTSLSRATEFWPNLHQNLRGRTIIYVLTS